MNFIITMRQRTCALRRPARTIPIFKNQLIHRTDVIYKMWRIIDCIGGCASIHSKHWVLTTFVYTDGARRRRLVLYGGMANGGDDNDDNDDASKMYMGSILRQRCGHFQSNLIKDGSRVVRAVKMVVAIRTRALLLAQSARGTPFRLVFVAQVFLCVFVFGENFMRCKRNSCECSFWQVSCYCTAPWICA